MRQALRDAWAFLGELIRLGVRTETLSFDAVDDSLFFEWRHVYVNIPFELDAARFYVHYIPGRDSPSTTFHCFTTATEAATRVQQCLSLMTCLE